VGCHEKPILHVFNKADLLPDPLDMQRYLREYQPALLFSAKTGEGMEQLKFMLDELINSRGKDRLSESENDGGRAEDRKLEKGQESDE
ncbi:MAG: hypothetical protein FWH49_07290, partial [Clostridiales bacterium]|nr:hypothetical protein [Clostridiales bacterium]